MLAAVELVTDKTKNTPLPAQAQPAVRLFDRARDNGLIVRAFAPDVLGYAPRLCRTEAEIDQIVNRARAMLDLTLDDPELRAAIA